MRRNAPDRRMPRARTALLAATLTAALALPAAALSEKEAASAIAERYDVEVLRVRPGTLDDRKVWMVTVMKPGGNRNDAFQVGTLTVDQETGELVPAFRPGSEAETRLERRPEAMRTGPWR